MLKALNNKLLQQEELSFSVGVRKQGLIEELVPQINVKTKNRLRKIVGDF